MKRMTIILCALLIAASLFAEIPAGKQTSLGLYVNAEEAYAMWQKNPQTIHIIDIRTPAEYVFIGHAPMAPNIPFKFFADEFDGAKIIMTANENFIQDIKAKYTETDTLILYCRSGGRGAAAVNTLAKAGFTAAYNMVDGFEGDSVKDEESYYHGKRLVNGWKNSNAPWTYKLDENLIYKK